MKEIPTCWLGNEFPDAVRLELLKPEIKLPEIIMQQLKMPMSVYYQIPYLYLITVLHGYKTVVEIGSGCTSITLAVAVKETGGHLFTVDLVLHDRPYNLVKSYNLEEYVTWIIDDDRHYINDWKHPIDHLWIDSSHKYTHTLWELKEWGKFVRQGGSITLHDINLGGPPSQYEKDHPVTTAIQKFLEECPRKTSYKEFGEGNGLGWIYFET